jgi:hypothetical protein
MNCQEVMELMQRYLDKDLEENEQTMLLHHVQQCSDCSELFSRLKQISSDLESLPKVAPAYSLVDAIIPRLEKLDQELLHAGDTLRPEQKNSSEHMDGASPRRMLARLRERISVRWAGGVIAAGLALVFFIFNHQNTALYQVDAMLSKEEKHSGGNRTTDGAGNINGKSGDPSVGQNGVAESGSTPKAMPEQQANETRGASSIQAQSGTITDKKDNVPTAQNNAKRSTTEPPVRAEREIVPPAEYGNEVANGSGQEDSSKSAEPKDSPVSPQASIFSNETSATSEASPSSSGQPTKNALPDKASGQATDSGADTVQQESIKSKANNPAAPRGTMMGIAAVPSAGDAGLPSNDHLYEAKIEGNRVVIYKAEDGQSVFKSGRQWKETDQIQLVSWSDDHVLTYQVNSGGTVKTFEIHVKDNSETEK